MKKKTLLIVAAICLFVLATSMLVACNDKNDDEVFNYADGVYTGESQRFEGEEGGVGSGYGVVTLTIKDNKVVDCTFEMYELDGTKKDPATYGMDLSKENRIKAQKAIQSADKYAQMLLERGSVKKVTVITGATISYNEFIQAVDDALNKAKITQ